ncbi:MAG: hypothetical protein ACRCYD_05905 [Plesiomonas sp.]
MTKRESGWYRVTIKGHCEYELAMYIDNHWLMNGAELPFYDYELDVDPQMVMTPEGEIVYHTVQHDPLYNTAQEQ